MSRKPKPKHRGLSDCILWPGYLDKGGYPLMFDSQEKLCRCHRKILEGHLGRPIQPGYMALHRCDTPSCVNPAHLYEGTHQDNMADRAKSNNTARGSRNGNAKLNEPIVEDVIRLLESGEDESTLAKSLSVTRQTIRNIRRRVSWTHVMYEEA